MIRSSHGRYDKFRLNSHTVIFNPNDQDLLLKADCGVKSWGLLGGVLEPIEIIYEVLICECHEELGSDVLINYLSGVYWRVNPMNKPLLPLSVLTKILSGKLRHRVCDTFFHGYKK